MFLRFLHSIGLTNLSDDEIERYYIKKRIEMPNRRSLSNSFRDFEIVEGFISAILLLLVIMKPFIGIILILIGLGGLFGEGGVAGVGIVFLVIGIALLGNIFRPKPKYKHVGSTHHYKKESCFTKSTLIYTPKGWREIGSINIGDFVFSYDPVNGQTNIRSVTKRLEHQPAPIWSISCSKFSEVVSTTSHHSFLTQRGWVLTKNLKIGDKVLMVDEDLNKEFDFISHIEETDRIESVYNLYTETEHTFIASGLVTHNFTYFRTFRTWLHNKFIDSKKKSLGDLALTKSKRTH